MRGKVTKRRGGEGEPPDDPGRTGEETLFLARHREQETPLAVHLVDGEVVRGRIEYYDREMVKIERPEKPHFFIRKSSIRYIVLDDGS